MTTASVTLTGRSTAAPELRDTPNGIPVANFTLAHTRRRLNAETGQWEDYGDTLFLRVTCWRDLAKNVASSIGKGDMVTVTGELGVRYWQTESGENRLEVTCAAEQVAADLRFQSATVHRTSSQPAEEPPATRRQAQPAAA